MIELEETIKSYLISKKVTDIEFFNINDDYYEFDPESKWVIDAGIQIRFGEDVFSYGWETEHEGLGYSLGRELKTILGDANYYELDAKSKTNIRSLIGKEINDVKINWSYYREYDENFVLKEEKTFVPVEIILTFDEDVFLQVAIIDFQIKVEPFEIVNAVHHINGNFLISFNELTKITNPEEKIN